MQSYVNQFIRLNCYFKQGQLNHHHHHRRRRRRDGVWCQWSMTDPSFASLQFYSFISFFVSKRAHTHTHMCSDVPERSDYWRQCAIKHKSRKGHLAQTKHFLLSKAINSIVSWKWLVYSLIGCMCRCRSMSWYDRSVSQFVHVCLCLWECSVCAHVLFFYQIYVESKRSLNIT